MPISGHPWHFVSRALTGGLPTLDFFVDVPGQISWQYSIDGHLAVDPLGGEPIQISRSQGTFPNRTGNLQLGAYRSPLREQERQHILDAWFLRGPFDVTTPEGETFGLMFLVVGSPGLTQSWQAGNRIFQAAIYEVA